MRSHHHHEREKCKGHDSVLQSQREKYQRPRLRHPKSRTAAVSTRLDEIGTGEEGKSYSQNPISSLPANNTEAVSCSFRSCLVDPSRSGRCGVVCGFGLLVCGSGGGGGGVTEEAIEAMDEEEEE